MVLLAVSSRCFIGQIISLLVVKEHESSKTSRKHAMVLRKQSSVFYQCRMLDDLFFSETWLSVLWAYKEHKVNICSISDTYLLMNICAFSFPELLSGVSTLVLHLL